MPELSIKERVEFPPFLAAEHIGKKLGAEAKATIASPHRDINRRDGTVGHVVDVKIGDIEYTFGLNKTSERLLVEKFGKNSDSWVGKEINLVRTEANNPKTNKMVPAIKVG